ncbi:hypothetical protein WICPIJ_007389 [Wickerhamomyces pijperi]|uniref:Uncharacterized protein n=1 Tax=Wickerhamomyces pijperi TaxID=599730 RepID=A0A9P8TJC1_WICPI|nr:hypothetical protein WICPIJ_007389 [Wickerhamomyces pijperi]
MMETLAFLKKSPEPPKPFGHHLGSQDQFLGELVPVLEQSIEPLFGQSDRCGSGVVQGTIFKQVQEGILQDFCPDVQVLEVGIGQTFNDSISDITNTGLWRVWRNDVSLVGLDDGNDPFWVHWNAVQTNFVVAASVWQWLSERRVHWHVNVVQAFERRSGGVDFDDDLVRDGDHFWGGTNSRARDDGPIFGDCGGLNDGVVQLVVLLFSGVEPVRQVLGKHGQVLVKELDSTLVDTLGNWSPDLVRGSLLDHVVGGPSGFFWTSRGTDEQVELQLAL